MPIKTIEYLTLRIEGFFSIIEPIEYKLNVKGINLIKGKNGSGKTTLLGALPWVAFGVDLKGRKNPEPYDELVGKGFKGTKVELDLRVDGVPYTIIRCHKYKGKLSDGNKGASKVVLIENGVPNLTLRDKPDIKKAIEGLLSMDYDVMVNSMIFGQKMKTLVEEKGAKRKEIFDSMFEVEYLNRAKSIAGKEKDKLSEEIKLTAAKHETLKTKLQLLRKTYQAKREKYRDLKTSLDEVEDTLKSVAKQDLPDEAKVKALEGKLEGYKKAISKIMEDRAGADSKIQTLKNKIQNLKLHNDLLTREEDKAKKTQPSIKDPQCKVCGSIIGSHVRKSIRRKTQDRINQIIDQRKENEIALSRLTLKLSRSQDVVGVDDVFLHKTQEAQDTVKRELAELKARANMAEVAKRLADTRVKLLKDLRAINPSELKADYKKNRRALLEGLGKLDVTSLNKRIKDVEWAIKEALSGSGMKAYIFDSMMVAVNNHLKAYSKFIGIRAEFYVDLSTSRKDINIRIKKGGIECSYEDLSGGQAQMVDFICLLAIHDTFDSKITTNLLGTDELFKYLDADNLEIAANILNQKAKSKAVYIMTHNRDFLIRNVRTTRVSLDAQQHTQLG